jgi:hypothetical protein
MGVRIQMSKHDAKELAKRFIDEQSRILESHGDSVVRSKYKDAVAGAQKTFEAISAKPATSEPTRKS